MPESPLTNSPAPPPIPAPQAAPVVSPDDKTLAMLCHLLAIFTGFLGPLIVWLVKKDSSAFVGHHGREALNFQLTLLLVMLCLGSATFALMLILVGFVLIPVLMVVPILALVAEIMAAVAAQNGEWFRYPCCIRMV